MTRNSGIELKLAVGLWLQGIISGKKMTISQLKVWLMLAPSPAAHLGSGTSVSSRLSKLIAAVSASRLRSTDLV
jgi:hypothetical protein